MAIILKKSEKIENVISKLSNGYTFNEFKEKFIELYEEDWKKTQKIYDNHIRKIKKGKKNPMPNPEQYLKNALNVWKKKTNT